MAIDQTYSKISLIEKRLDDTSLNFIFDFIKDEPLRQHELFSRVRDDADYQRSKNSLRLAAIRMHILVHGMLPLDMKSNPTWYHVPSTMVRFAESKGIDVEEQVKAAIEDGETRKGMTRDIARGMLDKAMEEHTPIIIKMVDHLRQHSPAHAWIRKDAVFKQIETRTGDMIRSIQDKKDPSEVVNSAMLTAIRELQQAQVNAARNREIKQRAREMERERAVRRKGSVFTGVKMGGYKKAN